MGTAKHPRRSPLAQKICGKVAGLEPYSAEIALAWPSEELAPQRASAPASAQRECRGFSGRKVRARKELSAPIEGSLN